MHGCRRILKRGNKLAPKKEAQKLCFVVGPIGDDDSEDRIHADWVLEEIILPVFEEHFTEFRVERADKVSNPGRIDEQIITALLSADLVIADLTTLNPNAFYEIGIRHTIQKPIIHMHLEGQRIPFDIASFRSIKFARKWPKDIRIARAALKEFVTTTQSLDFVADNPVTFSRGKVEFEKTATPSEKIIQDQLNDLSEKLYMLEKGSINSKYSLEPLHLRLVDDNNLLDMLKYNEKINIKKDTFRLTLVARDITSTAQLYKSADAYLNKYFQNYSIVHQSESELSIRLADNDKNRIAAQRFETDSEKLPYPVRVIIG